MGLFLQKVAPVWMGASVPFVATTGSRGSPSDPQEVTPSVHISRRSRSRHREDGPPPLYPVPLEWVQQLYTDAIGFCESSYRLIATAVPLERVPQRQPPEDPERQHLVDVHIALMYYSFQLYFSEVIEALEAKHQELAKGVPNRDPKKSIPPKPNDPHLELYAMLLDTQPHAVPWLIYLITLEQWRIIRTELVPTEASIFFQNHGNFDHLAQKLLELYRCRLVPTDQTYGALPPPVLPPTKSELEQRVAEIPQRLMGSFPFIKRLTTLLKKNPLAESLLHCVDTVVPENAIQPAALIPYVSAFTTFDVDGIPSLDHETILETFHRVMIEQWLLGAFSQWSQVTKNTFDTAFHEVQESLALFEAITQVIHISTTTIHKVASIERTTPGFFCFIQQARGLSTAHRRELYTLVTERKYRDLYKCWKLLTQIPKK